MEKGKGSDSGDLNGSEHDNGALESDDSLDNQLPTKTYRRWHTQTSDRRPLYNTTTFIFNKKLDRLEYAAGLQPSLWCTIPREIVCSIAEALRDILAPRVRVLEGRTRRSMLGNAAMTCRYWQRLFSPFQWKYTELERATSVHRLEEIISSPLSRRLKDNLRELSLFPYSNPHSDIESDRFFSAWRSLSRHLHPITHLDIWGSSQRYALKSYPIRLRPLPQHCLHIQTLDLQYITFPSFSALFRDVGALLFLERLILNGIRWGGVCDPHFPPMSAATFSAIKSVFASDCTDGGWPLAWMFTTAVLRYGRPWRALDDAEAARTRSVRLDTCAVVQAVRWMLSGRGLPTESLRLTIVPALPKGPTRMISQLSSILHGSNVALGFTITAPDSTASGPSEGAHGSLVGLVVCRKTRDPVEPWDKLDGALSGVAHPLAVDVLSWGTVSEDAEAYIQTRMPSATVRLHAVPGDKQLLNEGAIVEFWKRMDSAGATASRTRS